MKFVNQELNLPIEWADDTPPWGWADEPPTCELCDEYTLEGDLYEVDGCNVCETCKDDLED